MIRQTVINMKTRTSPHSEGGPALRPRIVDVSDMDYRTALSHVTPDADAYFERKPGRTNLIVR